jgi:diacylglycerol kinase family enzyme
MRYKIATIWKTLFFKWHNSEISVDGLQPKSITSLMLSIGNGVAIGGGIKMCPEAQIDDDYRKWIISCNLTFCKFCLLKVPNKFIDNYRNY